MKKLEVLFFMKKIRGFIYWGVFQFFNWTLLTSESTARKESNNSVVYLVNWLHMVRT